MDPLAVLAYRAKQSPPLIGIGIGIGLTPHLFRGKIFILGVELAVVNPLANSKSIHLPNLNSIASCIREILKAV